MARWGDNIAITPSVLDRLIDLDPSVSADPPRSRQIGLRELRQSVRRDLEWLLNARCYGDEDLADDAEMRRSVAFYGIPDIMGMSPKSPAEQKRLSKALESAIRHFEPRLLDLKVTLDTVGHLDRDLRFRIEARLDVEPTPEPVVFDSVLENGSGEFSVVER